MPSEKKSISVPGSWPDYGTMYCIVTTRGTPDAVPTTTHASKMVTMITLARFL